MKKDILLIDPHAPKESWAESYISLQPFTDFLQDKIASGEGIKFTYYQYVLDKVLAHPELQGTIGINEIHRYESLLELISTVVFPIMEDENEFLWAFGNALTPEVFYGSNAFYNLFSTTKQQSGPGAYLSSAESVALVKELQLELILEKVYSFTTDQRKEWIQGFIHPDTGLYQYYRINIDRRFTNLKLNANVPAIDTAAIEACLACDDGMQQLEDMLPLKNLVASGFTIITLIDVTAKYALDQLGKEVAGFHMKNSTVAFKQLTRLLQTIAGNQYYQFGIMSIFTINNRPALLYENFPFSIIVKACVEQGTPKRVFDLFIRQFLKTPGFISHSPATTNKLLPAVIASALNKSGIFYYSLAPVYAGEQLVGIFEISTNENIAVTGNRLRETMLPVMPYVAQLVTYFNDKFNATIDTIIKNQFTNIQPSVQWKFNEVAWHYFRNNMVEKKQAGLESIAFSEVYPLYGAVDIQNSTIERNKALRKDLRFQLNKLREILLAIEKNSLAEVARQFVVACDFWLYQLTDFITIEQELQVNDFLQAEIQPYLETLQPPDQNELIEKIREYKDAIDEVNGEAFFERRKLESAIRMINSGVGQYLDLFNVELQTTYPCYFEKLRTDGVEYDIYMGQSISPKTPFEMLHLNTTRLLQLQSMAAIARLTDSLIPQLEHPLLTTQLIFVHSRSIDISFRNDERRFDVEGAYNIRYHIIKKRIDKVHIRNTDSRLTQPGKIAIVYYNEKSVTEYEAYIKQLQEKNILQNNLEHLELEELQGISGLRALRVGVNLQ